MDTILQIPAKLIKNFELIQPVKLSEDELTTIVDYICLTRDAQETKQLFDVFYFNLLCLRNNFTLYAGDTVEKLPNCPEYSSENIAVNALVINLISSAKTLVERLRGDVGRWLDKNGTNEDTFNEYVRNIYDESMVYRILMNLRDFAQYGNLPVSLKDGRYSFDISQILETPHFKLNKQVQTDMNNFLSNFNPSEKVACLALTITISDFVVKVIDIYRKFLFYIKDYISSSYRKIQKMIELNPTIICNTHEAFKGYIIFSAEGMYHALNPNDNPNKMICEYVKDIADIFRDEKKSFDELNSLFISCQKES